MKRFLLVCMVVIVSLTTFPIINIAAQEPSYVYNKEAEALNGLGLYKGISTTSFVPDLSTNLDRQTGVVLLLRIIALEEQAKQLTDNEANTILAKFIDQDRIQPWARKSVAYAVSHNIVSGISTTQMSPDAPLLGQAYATLFLRAIGYTPIYTGATYELFEKGGIPSHEEADRLHTKKLIKDDVVGISFYSLFVEYSNGKTVADILIEKGVFTKENFEQISNEFEMEEVNNSTETVIDPMIENFGFDLQPFDIATGYAGSAKVTGVRYPYYDNDERANAAGRFIINDYGNGPTRPQDRADYIDPQMTFRLPVGTAVIALVTGEVCSTPVLYSNDYSIHIARKGMCSAQNGDYYVFEHEHVIDPLVKVGDQVTAGQHIATVSDYDQGWNTVGMGTLEIGILFSQGSRPAHACPAQYIKPDKKEVLLNNLSSLRAAWENEIGDNALYNEEAMPIQGCITTKIAVE